jgi:hypothetical protein
MCFAQRLHCCQSLNGTHCFHSEFGDGRPYWSTVPPRLRCCHCGMYEGDLHGPFKPHTPYMTTTGTVTVQISNNTLDTVPTWNTKTTIG